MKQNKILALSGLVYGVLLPEGYTPDAGQVRHEEYAVPGVEALHESSLVG